MPNNRARRFADTEVFLLHEIAAHFDHRAKATSLDAHGLTYSEFLLLLAVREMPDASQTLVAQTFDFSPSTVSQRVARLASRGLLTQRRDETNRRVVHLRLTGTGETLLSEVYDELSSRASAVFDVLGDRRAEFRAALVTVCEVLQHTPHAR